MGPQRPTVRDRGESFRVICGVPDMFPGFIHKVHSKTNLSNLVVTVISASAPNEVRSAGIPNNRYENRSWSSWIFLVFSSFFPTEVAPNEHDTGRGWGGRCIGGRGEGGADAPAARAHPSEHAAAPARPASADAIKEMMLALERCHQARSGVPGGGSTDDASGSGLEGQQGSGTHLAGQVAVTGDGALVNICKARNRAKKGTGSSASQGVSESGTFKSPRGPSTVHGGGSSSTRPRPGTTRPGMSIRPCALSVYKRRISKEPRSSSARAICPRP